MITMQVCGLGSKFVLIPISVRRTGDETADDRQEDGGTPSSISGTACCHAVTKPLSGLNDVNFIKGRQAVHVP